MEWLVDGSNVMGSRPDGWWNDRPAAAARLVDQIARWCLTLDDQVTVVFDGPALPGAQRLGGGNLVVDVATRRGRDAADDRIVELAGQRERPHDRLTVVTADRGLVARLPTGVTVEGPRTFLGRLGSTGPPGARRGSSGRRS